MTKIYDITLGGDTVGTARISREGLYIRFDCLCKFPDRGIYRLYSQCENRTADLGICVPRGDAFGLTTRIPVSRLGEGSITVFAKGKGEQAAPAIQDTPFRCLEDLDNAVLTDTGIVVRARSQAPQDSGQNQEYPHK